MTLESAQEVLHDLLRANDRRVTIDEIQKRVAEHYNITARRHAFGAPRPRRRPAAPGGDVSLQATDAALAAGDRPQIRRPRPHHGDARRAQDRGVARSDRAMAEDIELLRRMLEELTRAPHPSRAPVRPSGEYQAARRTPYGVPSECIPSHWCYSPPFRPVLGRRRGLREGASGAVIRPIKLTRSMKLTIERAALLKALGHVQSVVERRNTIPILSNVLLRAEERRAGAARRTDMDLEIVDRGRGAGRAQGRAPPRRPTRSTTSFASCAKARRSSSKPTGDKGAMTLRSGRSTFTLACLPPEDYPLMAGGELAHSFTLSAADLKRLIDRTRFAISTEETRYYLNGIYLHAAKSDEVPMLRAVATDGHRLARMEMPLPEGAAGMPGVIVPRKTVSELRKLLDEIDQDVDDRAVRHQDPLRLRRHGADLEADRRHLPGLRPGHPDRQRQASSRSSARSSPRRSTASRPSPPRRAGR